MRTLIVIGATGGGSPAHVENAIAKALIPWADQVQYADDRDTAFRLLNANSDAYIAYAPGCWGFAIVGGPASPHIVTADRPQFLITALEHDQWTGSFHETDDPRQHQVGAALILDAPYLVNVLNERSMERFSGFFAPVEAL